MSNRHVHGLTAIAAIVVFAVGTAAPVAADLGDTSDGGGSAGNEEFLVWSLAHDSHLKGTAQQIPCEITQERLGPDGQPAPGPNGELEETVQGHITYSDTLNSQEVLLGITGETREGRFIRVECNGDGIRDDNINTLVSVPFIVDVDNLDLLDVSLERMGIPEPPINTSPGGSQPQLVNLETWLWLDPAYWQPRSLSATADAGLVTITATLTATPERVVWDLGDGGSVTCEGPGTVYNRGASAGSQSTDCGYTYRRSSAGRSGGAYLMTATVTWSGTYVLSIGGGGDLGTLDVTSDPVPVRVAESQAVVTG